MLAPFAQKLGNRFELDAGGRQTRAHTESGRDDDDDDGIFTLAHLPETLPVVTKQAETKAIHLDGNTNKYDIRRKSVLVGKGNGTIELWYTIPYRLQLNNTRYISMASYINLNREVNKK